MISLLLLLSSLLPQAQISQVPRETKLRLFEIINRDRAEVGLNPVEFSDELSRLADNHCREMLREGYVSHWNRSGWKPYLRYAGAGISAYTSENIGALWETSFPADSERIWANILYAHRSFLAEQPPNDGHRRSILDAQNTMVGIGIVYNGGGMRLIEIFGAKYAELDPLPLRASLERTLRVRGHILDPRLSLMSISVYYEPLPKLMSLDELRATSAYGLPDEEMQERPKLPPGVYYEDHTPGIVEVDPHGVFSAPLLYWKGQPGVYTVAVWLRRGKEKPFIGAMVPVLVDSR